jgi:hypothetical protein
MDAKGADDLADGLSFSQEPLCEILLLRIHLPGASEANTTFLSLGATGSSTLPDEIALELSYPSENGHDHLSGVGSGVSPGFGDRLKTGTGIADHFDEAHRFRRTGTRDRDISPTMTLPQILR